MDEKTLELFNDSFEYCVSKKDFLPRFYELFLASSPEIRKRFINTDIRRQSRILKKSLYILTMATIGTEEAHRELIRLGKSHGLQGMNIPNYMYDLWLDCLLRTVSEFQTDWKPEIENSWREMLNPHIEILKSFGCQDTNE